MAYEKRRRSAGSRDFRCGRSPLDVPSRALYLVIALVAALIAVWLALQILGFLFKLVFLIAAALVAVAAYRSWKEASR